MYSNALTKWADNFSDFADKTYGQGKDAYYNARRKAERLAREKAQLISKKGPELKAKFNIVKSNAENKFDRFRRNFNDSVYSSEAAVIKLTGVYLLFKWFKHRDKDVYEKVESVKAHILEKPLKSAVIALGVGFAIGRLLK